MTPSRFREGETRAARIGRIVRRVGRVTEVDEELMAEIGRDYLSRDELGARLAASMRRRPEEAGRVGRADLRSALEYGSASVPDEQKELREFLSAIETTPVWVDWERVERGQRVYSRFGQNAGDVLLQLSLIGGYRFGGPTDLLVATGGLTGRRTLRRLAETQHWTLALSQPGSLRPYAKAWRLTAEVRLMHAMVNETLLPRWDVERWGLPINDADQASTLGLFDATVLLGVRALGVRVTKRDADDVMHMWRYVGWLLGIKERYLVDDERARHRLNYHLLLAQADVTEAGPLLARALVRANSERHFDRLPALRARFEHERLLSMLTVFLGVRGMRDLELPLRPPWAHAYVTAANVWRYWTPWGRRGLDAWATSLRERQEREYFGGDPADVADPIGA